MISFTAVVLTGGPRRTEITSVVLDSLNHQTYSPIQKILINGGGPPTETEYFRARGILTPDWEVIDFPVDTMLKDDVFSTYRFPGKAALQIASGDYIYLTNDDDYLADDFFERMAALFTRYPTAITGMGSPRSWNPVNREITEASYHFGWSERPEVMPGMDFVRSSLKIEGWYGNPGFCFVMKTDYVRQVSDTLFTSGYPDWSVPLQVVSRGDTVFDPEALMYWGRHPGQDHFIWDEKHYWTGCYKHIFSEISRINNLVLDIWLPGSSEEQKLIKRYFRKQTVRASFTAIATRVNPMGKILRSRKRSTPYPDSNGRKFRYGIHLRILLMDPLHAVGLFFKFLKDSIDFRLRGNP